MPKTRSITQNKYYWGVVLNTISIYTENELKEVHDFFKAQFLRKENVFLNVPMSTTKLNTTEFIEYIDKIKKFVDDNLNLYIPPIDDIPLPIE